MPTTRAERALALVGLLILLPLVALVVFAWRAYDGDRPRVPGASTPAAPAATTTPERRTLATSPRPVRAAAPATAKVQLVAARGECWLDVRIGDASGRVVFAGILPLGERRRFTARRLWIQLGAPHVLDGTVNGTAAELPDTTSTVVATAAGIRTVGS